MNIKELIEMNDMLDIKAELERLWRIEECAESAVFGWEQNEVFTTSMILLKQALAAKGSE